MGAKFGAESLLLALIHRQATECLSFLKFGQRRDLYFGIKKWLGHFIIRKSILKCSIRAFEKFSFKRVKIGAKFGAHLFDKSVISDQKIDFGDIFHRKSS